MTHGPPEGILDQCPAGSVGCENLLRAVRRVKPTMHCFGHIHEQNGVQVVDWDQPLSGIGKPGNSKNPYPEPFVWETGRGSQTLAVNAAIMTVSGEPDNAPWLISLPLPRSS